MTKSEHSNFAVITVQFRNAADTAALAASLAKLSGAESIDLVVVDNAAPDATTSSEQELRPGLPFPIRWLATESNLYYWGGASFALETIRAEDGSLPRWVVICNNDITIAEPNFLTILSKLDPLSYPIIAPRIVSTVSGRDQNPLLETPPAPLKRLKWAVYDLNYHIARSMLSVHASFGRKLATQHSKIERSGTGTPRNIYAPHGACVILSSTFFEKGGSLDTAIPMFAEELTLAEEATRLAMPIRYVPELSINHAEHSTTGSDLTKQKYDMQRAARRHYYSLFHQNRARQ